MFADTYSVANTLPTIVYILLVGGAINAVFIPQLVRHMSSDGDAGIAYAQRLFSAVVLVLAVITVGAVMAAPWLVRLYSTGWNQNDIDVATAFAQAAAAADLLLRGLRARLAGAEHPGRFGAPMFAPVVNNIVTIASAVAFMVVAGTGTTTKTGHEHRGTAPGDRHHPRSSGAGRGAVALAAPVRSSASAAHRPARSGARQGLALARWAMVLVLVNQLGTLVIIRLATGINTESDTDAGAAVYQMAFAIFMLPQSVITVSLVTALLPSPVQSKRPPAGSTSCASASVDAANARAR